MRVRHCRAATAKSPGVRFFIRSSRVVDQVDFTQLKGGQQIGE